jgi:hypothetical protein
VARIRTKIGAARSSMVATMARPEGIAAWPVTHFLPGSHMLSDNVRFTSESRPCAVHQPMSALGQ